MVKKIAIVGGGSWGTALAQLMSDKGHKVKLYVRNDEIKDTINNRNVNSKYFPDYSLNPDIEASTNLEEVIKFAHIILLTVPTHATRVVMKKISPYLGGKQIIVSTAKGIEEETFLSNSEIIKEFTYLPVVVLSGPTHAEEVINNLPTAVVVAARDNEIANYIQDMMITPTFRVYTNPDVTGVEMGGAIKNIIAVAAGICDGLDYGDNTRAALITRGLHEISKLGAHLGGDLLTFTGLAGLGDLVVTCSSMHSRNRRLGIKIGEGLSLDKALKSINQVVEGVRTTRAIYQWYQKQDLDFELPITRQIYQVLFQGKDPHQAVDELMLRGPKQEIDDVIIEENN